MSTWRVVLEQDPETGEWAAWCPELPGCTSSGTTEEEALSNIREAIELYLAPDDLDLAIAQRVVTAPYPPPASDA